VTPKLSSLVLAAALLAGVVCNAAAATISVRTRIEHPPEMAPMSVLEVIHESERYWIPLPRRWQSESDAESGTVTLKSYKERTTLTLRFSSDDPRPAFNSAGSLRQLAAPQIRNAKLLEEFPFNSEGTEGRGAFFSYESDMRCRIAVIPLPKGHVSFALSCPAPDAATGEKTLAGFLTTFRSVSDTEALARQAEEVRLIRMQPVQPPAPNVILGMEAIQPEPLPEATVPPPPPTWLEEQREHIMLFITVGLLIALTHSVLARHRLEAEIRALAGGYLSDGTEVASFKMPDWFAPPPPPPTPAPEDAVPVLSETTNLEAAKLPDPVTNFLFEIAPEALASIRAVLKELVGVEEPKARHEILLKLHQFVLDLGLKADRWELRPVWQLSSALELLIKRITDKPKDVSPSALRTISSACDLLHELCVPGVRPSLIMEPPPRIMAVDDETLCLRALAFALQKANLAPDVAQDGKRAVELATQKPYDVIFMDINMPEMDGLAACANIRQTPLNDGTPIVFVTAITDFAMRARTIAIGGTDFMAKPFLVFELTVKAMTLLMRKRLDVSKANRAPALLPKLAPAPTPIPAPPAKPELEPVAEAQVAA